MDVKEESGMWTDCGFGVWRLRKSLYDGSVENEHSGRIFAVKAPSLILGEGFRKVLSTAEAGNWGPQGREAGG